MSTDNDLSIEKVCRHFWYRIARMAPTNAMRRYALNRMSFVRVGRDCFIGPGITITPFGDVVEEPWLLSIADRARISPNVTFLCSMIPKKTKLAQWYGRREPITVEEDAWIGADATILAGVTVGKCALVGAGSVVTKDIPPYTVVGGVPAEHIKDIEDES